MSCLYRKKISKDALDLSPTMHSTMHSKAKRILWNPTEQQRHETKSGDAAVADSWYRHDSSHRLTLMAGKITTIKINHSSPSWGCKWMLGGVSCLASSCAPVYFHFPGMETRTTTNWQTEYRLQTNAGCSVQQILRAYEIYFLNLCFSISFFWIFWTFTLILTSERVCTTVFSLFFTWASAHKCSLLISPCFQSALCWQNLETVSELTQKLFRNRLALYLG